MIQIAKSLHVERYAEVKREIDRQFPAGYFVAVEAGKPLANAPTHPQLVDELRGLGRGPKDMLILQAGVEYPKSATIFWASPLANRDV